MSTLDEVELEKLEEAVETAKKLIGFGGVGSEATSMLVGASLAAAEHRIDFLEQEIDGEFSERGRKESEKAQALVVGYLVQREIHLSEIEREQFAGFLESPFFTRNDFEELNDFYSSTYDRLSERGKAEMSTRVWEGVRRGEYLFSQLPENTREKEMERLFGLLTDPEQMPENLNRIPESDREEFISAMEAGEAAKAAKLLNQEVFSENVSTQKELEESKTAEQSQERDEEALEAQNREDSRNSSKSPTQLAMESGEQLSAIEI